ncbi:MAG: SPOR domain-containing protein, partial [Methanococcaceae archaeon]
MEKEDLINSVASALGASEQEIKIAFDIFIQKVSDFLHLDGTIKIPEIGMFQLKKRLLSKNDRSKISSFYLVFSPIKYAGKTAGETLKFDIASKPVNVKEFDDSIFSPGIDKPLIPVAGLKKKELYFQSNYIMMQKDFEEKVNKLLSHAIDLDNFDLEDVRKTEGGEFDDFNLAEDREPVNFEPEHIPWDFGSEPDIEENPTVDSKEIIAQDDLWDSLKSGLEENNSEENSLETPSEKSNYNYEEFFRPGTDNTDIAANQYSDDEKFTAGDLLNSQDEFLAEDELSGVDTYVPNSIEPDNDEGFDDQLKSFTEEEDETTGLEEFHEEGAHENNEMALINETSAISHDYTGELQLEEAEEKTKDKISVVIWLVLLAIVLFSAGGIYYFMFYKKNGQNTSVSQHIQDAGKPQIKSQVVERNYDYPVSIVPKSREEESKSQNQGDKTTAVPQDNQKKTEDLKVPDKTIEKVKPETNQPKVESSGLMRIDNKDKIVKENIFSDGSKFTIQVSSWKRKAEAIQEVELYRKHGYDAYYTIFQKKGSTPWYRVRIGEYTTLGDAD